MMTLYEVIHGVAFAQAFNFYMQQRSLIPPGTLDDGFNSRIAFAQDLEAAQEYAHTQANLAWAFYQKVTPGPVYGWDEDTDTFHGRQPVKASGMQPVVSRPTTPPPPPPPRKVTNPNVTNPTVTNPNLARSTRDPHLKRTVKVPPVRIPTQIDPREWRNEDPPPTDTPGTYPYCR